MQLATISGKRTKPKFAFSAMKHCRQFAEAFGGFQALYFMWKQCATRHLQYRAVAEGGSSECQTCVAKQEVESKKECRTCHVSKSKAGFDEMQWGMPKKKRRQCRDSRQKAQKNFLLHLQTRQSQRPLRCNAQSYRKRRKMAHHLLHCQMISLSSENVKTMRACEQ